MGRQTHQRYLALHEGVKTKLDHILDALDNLSNNLLSHSVVRPFVLKRMIEHVRQQLVEKYTYYELVISEVHDYNNIPVSSFDYVDGILGVFVPSFIRPNLQEPMYVYNVKTIPVPYHINVEMVDETENENAYTQIIPDTEMVAMSRDTYINIDQSELKQCIKFSVMYFCEQTFLMKHTSEHTCETAIYHEQSLDLIKDKCNIQYHPELNPTPQILDAGKHILLGNILEPCAKCFLPIMHGSFAGFLVSYFVMPKACAGWGNCCERLHEFFVRVLRSSRVNFNNVNNTNVFSCV